MSAMIKSSAMRLLRRPLRSAVAQAMERRTLQSVAAAAVPSSLNTVSLFPTPEVAPARPFPTPSPMWESKLSSKAAAKAFTPVMRLDSNIYAKLEGFNVGGSIKDRAVMQCTVGMLESGKLKSGDTLAVSTSGNAGRSLLYVSEMLQKKGITIHVKIFMPKRYLTRDVPKLISETPGVKVTLGDEESTSSYSTPHKDGQVSSHLHGLDGEFMDVQQKMAILAKEHDWAVLDQHYDVNSLHAHMSTAQEIIQQIPGVTDVVCTTGTGGTASGLRQYLPAHVNVHARPAKPGQVDGITDVRRYANFCDPDLLEGYSNGFFDLQHSIDHQKELEATHNIIAGQSSGAAFALAKDIVRKNPKAQVAFICADGSTTTLPSTWHGHGLA